MVKLRRLAKLQSYATRTPCLTKKLTSYFDSISVTTKNVDVLGQNRCLLLKVSKATAAEPQPTAVINRGTRLVGMAGMRPEKEVGIVG